MGPDVVEQWAEQPDISARSVIVTIIGDTLVPVGASMWMNQMLQLTSVFGFSDRLVRTSMTRLVNDEWLRNERVGRQSKYHLTELARRESTQAAERIYGVDTPDWSGEWTLVFLPGSPTGSLDRGVSDALRWHGFVRIGRDALASPSVKPEVAKELMALHAPQLSPAIATATFDELERLTADGFFVNAVDSNDQADAYALFVDRYCPLATKVGTKTDGRTAFGLRTMLVHDLRRIRLRWPDPPPATRPPNWSGGEAAAIAAELYPRLVIASANWLSDVFDDNYPAQHPGRFGLT